MIPIALLIGAAVLTLGVGLSSASSDLYRCVLDGQEVAPDQRVAFEIAVTPNGEFGSIIFRAANGAGL